MSNHLIIDSNNNYAEKLYTALTNGTGQPTEDLKFTLGVDNLKSFSAEVAGWAKKNGPRARILINAEGRIKDGYIQEQRLVELAFWIRCKHRLLNPIIFYSVRPVKALLNARPENYILLAPGCYHFTLPLGFRELEAVEGCQPLDDLNSLRSFLKPKVNLEQTRHAYANYAAMAFMLLVAADVWGGGQDPMAFAGSYASPELLSFLGSLDYAILSTYFGLYRENQWPRARAGAFKINGNVLDSKKILLIDDLAEAGWRQIISQVIFGRPDEAASLIALTTPSHTELDAAIDKYGPHLILLDLRLKDEKGKRKAEELGGFELLTYLKSQDQYKGVPVIMFTATSNAETTKVLLGAGAEAVWTKPGIDEVLSNEEVSARYSSLISYVSDALSRFDRAVNLRMGTDFEDKRLEALRQIQYVNYRARLIPKTDNAFSDYTDIFIDTNIILDSAEAMSKIYKLAHTCGEHSHLLETDVGQHLVNCPKIVFVNFVVDELIEKSKTIMVKDRSLWKIALFGYEIIRSLFGQGLARTEINSFTARGVPEYALRRPQTDHHADPKIIDDIINIISHQEFELRRVYQPGGRGAPWRWDVKKARYMDPKSKVLLITNESKAKPDKLPPILEGKISALATTFGAVEVLNYGEFENHINRITL